MVHIPNEIAPDAFSFKDNGIDITEEAYEEIVEWADGLKFDDDPADFARAIVVGEMEVGYEDHGRASDVISIQDNTSVGFVTVDEFMEMNE